MDKKVVEASSLKQGNYIIMDGIACKIVSIQTSKTGKHGHSKGRVEAVGLIDSQKKVKIFPGHDKVEVPLVEKKSAQILSIVGDSATVMDSESFETFDLKIPEDMKSDVKEGGSVMYWIILGDKVMRQVK